MVSVADISKLAGLRLRAFRRVRAEARRRFGVCREADNATYEILQEAARCEVLRSDNLDDPTLWRKVNEFFDRYELEHPHGSNDGQDTVNDGPLTPGPR